MDEKVIHELRIIETEDGFRIEIKGDKERLREMGFGKGFPFGFGRIMGHGPFGRHRAHGFGFPFGRHGGPFWGEAEPSTKEPSSKV